MDKAMMIIFSFIIGVLGAMALVIASIINNPPLFIIGGVIIFIAILGMVFPRYL